MCDLEICSWRHISTFRILTAACITDLRSLLKMGHLSTCQCNLKDLFEVRLVAKGTVILNQPLISTGSLKKVYFSRGLMLSSSICLKGA